MSLMPFWLQADLEGKFWACFGIEEPLQLDTTLSSLLDGEWLCEKISSRKNLQVKIHAISQNHQLIMALFLSREKLGISKIILHRPVVTNVPVGSVVYSKLNYASSDDSSDGSSDLPPSLGGPREFSYPDPITMRLSEHMKRGDESKWESMLELAKMHPAWPAFTFLPVTFSCEAVRLISLIGDPRWYVNPDRSDSSKTLINAFGLGLDGIDNMNAILTGVTGQKRVSCALAVVRAWYADNPPTIETGWIVNTFIRSRVAGGRAGAMLAASRRFLRAVCSVWLDNLTDARVYEAPACINPDGTSQRGTPGKLMPAVGPYNPQLFVPEHEFSDDPLLRDHWNEHISRWRSEHQRR